MHDIQPIAKLPRVAKLKSEEAAMLACFGHKMIKFLAETDRAENADDIVRIPAYGDYHFGDVDGISSLQDVCLSKAKLEICGGSPVAGILLEFLCALHDKKIVATANALELANLGNMPHPEFEVGMFDAHLTTVEIEQRLLGMYTVAAINKAVKLLVHLGFIKVSKSKSVPGAKCYHLMLGAIRNALLGYYEVGQ